MGFLHDSRAVLPQDYGQAAQWYRKAAQQGYADAQARLGFFYDSGRGMPQNRIVAYALLDRAATQAASDEERASQAGASPAAYPPQPKAKTGQTWGSRLSHWLQDLIFNRQDQRDQRDPQYLSVKNRATRERAALADKMTEQEIKAGKTLSQEMSRPGNLLKALDQYLATAGDSKPQEGAAQEK
jgi:TPR repeat protein